MRIDARINPLAITLFIGWFLLLIPWSTLGLLGMGLAFDAGHTPKVYIFVWSIGSYPAVVVIALILALARRDSRFALLPLLNVAVFLATSG